MSREKVMMMAEPDCRLGKLMGYRACDVCGNPIMSAGVRDLLPCSARPRLHRAGSKHHAVGQPKRGAQQLALVLCCWANGAGSGDTGLHVCPGGMTFGIDRRSCREGDRVQLSASERP